MLMDLQMPVVVERCVDAAPCFALRNLSKLLWLQHALALSRVGCFSVPHLSLLNWQSDVALISVRMAQLSLVQASASMASFTGVNFSLLTVQVTGAQGGLINMAGGDRDQAVRAFQSTLQSGGYGRLKSSLECIDSLIFNFGGSQTASGNREHLGICEPVLKSLVVRGKFVGFGRFSKPVTVVQYSPPDNLRKTTRRILAVSALWVEVFGAHGLGDFITECVKRVVGVPNELLEELSRACSSLADDLNKSGLGIFHNEQELSKLLGDEVKSILQEDSSWTQPTKYELSDLLWALCIDADSPGGEYDTNDALVWFTYSILEAEFSESFPFKLLYKPDKNRIQVKSLPSFPGSPGASSFKSEPWLVPCTFDDFWDLMYIHNRPLIGNSSIGELSYQEKVKSMLEMLMEHTSMSPTASEDKGLCSNLSFDTACVEIRDKMLYRATEKACRSALHPELADIAARVALSVNFTSEELKLVEAVERGFSVMPMTSGGGYDPEEDISRSVDFKKRTMALLMLQTIVKKSVQHELHDGLQLFTPAMYATIEDLRSILLALLDRGLTIQLWRTILASAWFIGGKDIQYKVNNMRSDIKDCVGVMGPRATVLIGGLLKGSDDVEANNKLWICNGPVPDLPATSSGLILIDSAFESMRGHLLPKTFEMDVTPAPPDTSAPVLDLGPSYSSDLNKIRSSIRVDGFSIGYFSPVVAMSHMFTCAAPCSCTSRRGMNQDGSSGVYKGWPVKMSDVVDRPGFLRFSVGGGTATKLLLMTEGNQTWRFCLAGVYDKPIISLGCARCVEEKIVGLGVSQYKPVIIL
ncbi:hypothetical protein R1sor_010189 [Riccia sorocarpa]|uniref:Uncharacterized protein n=1 Tax=Riccia sorocarpa TaxID=122646 RepID=A0ABD3HXJ5_9MARC